MFSGVLFFFHLARGVAMKVVVVVVVVVGVGGIKLRKDTVL